LETLTSPNCGSLDMPVFISGGGSLLSTAADYVRFAQMLLNGGELDGVRLLRPETVELMRTNRLPDNLIPIGVRPGADIVGNGFGLGFRVVTDAAVTPVPDTDGVFGWSGAASTYFWIDPAEELIGIVLAQFEPNTRKEMEDEFQALVYGAINR
jgi:CubicO group peptidase (beta-lactamase class C family)